MNSLVFRDARPGDEATVAHFVRRLAEYGTPPRVSAMIVERDGQPIGFALWYYIFSTFTGRPGLYLEDIFVEPEHRGAGIGKTIFRLLARRALDEGCTRMDWSVLDWNAPSIAFYRALGAVGMDDWTVQRLEGAALLAVAEGT